MNKKGFAISGMIYTILLLFMMLIVMMLFNLQNRKMVLDEIKEEVVEAVEKDNEMEVLENRIKILEVSTNAINTFIKSHPVGSIYVTVASDEASVSMMNNKYTGSTWEAYGSGRTLVGVGSNGTTNYNKPEVIGGSETHKHISPTVTFFHDGRWYIGRSGIYGGIDYKGTKYGVWGSTQDIANEQIPETVEKGHMYTSTTSNLSPYITVYMYKRIS